MDAKLLDEMFELLGVTVTVENRQTYFAATTNPYALTAYANSEQGAKERALEMVNLWHANHPKFQLLHGKDETGNDQYVARVRQFGVTAYGKTKDEAVTKAIKMTSGLLELTFRDLEVEEL
jgi:hypothetical protein